MTFVARLTTGRAPAQIRAGRLQAGPRARSGIECVSRTRIEDCAKRAVDVMSVFDEQDRFALFQTSGRSRDSVVRL